MNGSINAKIRYIAGTESPLSADVGVIQTPEGLWLFDVGNGEAVARQLPPCRGVICSHFHPDHVGNISRVQTPRILLSHETEKHLHLGTVIRNACTVENMYLFLLPSAHAKGCLCAEVDGFVFVGDALCGKLRPDGVYYNAHLLRGQMETLSALRAEKVLLSHQMDAPREKSEILAELQKIYAQCDKSGAWCRI